MNHKERMEYAKLINDYTKEVNSIWKKEGSKMIELNIKDKVTLINAVHEFGKKSQVMVAIEEMAELTKELCNDLRNRDCNIAEEMADVYIMLLQLQIIYDNGPEIQEWLNKKVGRLATTIRLEQSGRVKDAEDK